MMTFTGSIHCIPKPLSAITVQSAGKTNAVPYLVRNHRIAIYSDEMKKTLAYLK
ncbi:hypothetical protein [Mucilaginibacter koreensis]